jgi:general secretion pathway protein G
MILLGMGAGNYQNSVLRSKEAVLRQDLYVLRQAIDQYTLDKQEAPQSLEDLVSAGYLRSVPVDPMTGTKDWALEYGDTVLSPEQTATGVTDVRSGSSAVSPFTGEPYNSW